MRTRITRPTLAELWRVLLADLEGLGVESAPEVARSLAVAGLTGRPAEARGVRVEPHGEDVMISLVGRHNAPSHPRRGRALAAR